MKRTCWFAGLLLIWFSLFSQPIRNDTLVQDFNQDGIMDSLLVRHSSGSWVYGEEVLFWDGRSGETYQFYPEFYFGSFWHIIDIPDDFWQEEYKALREALAPTAIQLDQPLPALQWLIDATRHGKRHEDRPHVDWSWNDGLQWHNWPPAPDSNYFVEIDGTLRTQLAGESRSMPSWVSYYGHNHRNRMGPGENDGPSVLTKKGTGTAPWSYEMFTTAHGVLIKRAEQFAWAFINDAEATGGTGKLRWPSLKEVYSWGQYLLIVQDVPLEKDEKLWSLNLETGALLRWKTPEDDQIRQVEMVEDQMRIQLFRWEADESETLKFSLEEWEAMMREK